MSSFHQEISRHIERQKIQFEGIGQASESDIDMAKMLESTDYKFKATMINMPRVLMEKMDNMKEQMGNVSRQMETLRVIQRKCKKSKLLLQKQRMPLMGSLVDWTQLKKKQ